MKILIWNEQQKMCPTTLLLSSNPSSIYMFFYKLRWSISWPLDCIGKDVTTEVNILPTNFHLGIFFVAPISQFSSMTKSNLFIHFFNTFSIDITFSQLFLHNLKKRLSFLCHYGVHWHHRRKIDTFSKVVDKKLWEDCAPKRILFFIE